jgi:type VI secretion system protein ImpJ
VVARGIMPDGTLFQIPESDAGPLRRFLDDDLFDEEQSVDLYLTLPAYRANGPNIEASRRVVDTPDGNHAGAASAASRMRYLSETRAVPDETSVVDIQPIQLGRKNFTLKTAAERTAGVDVSMRLARILHRGDSLVIDSAAVPASLAIDAFQCKEREAGLDKSGQPVMTRVSEMTDLAQNLAIVAGKKIADLARQRHSQPTRTLTEQSLAGFWLLQTLQRSLPSLQHFLDNPREHPSLLFRELLRLAGALCTFALDSEANDLPRYCHQDSGPGFSKLAENIRRHLHLSFSTNVVEIKLQPFDGYYFRAEFEDPRFKPESRWVLGIKSALTESQLRKSVPPTVKISSHDWIKKAIDKSVADVPVSYIEPPDAVDPKDGYRYFAVDGSHEDFVPVFTRHGIGIYVPGPVALAEISLHVII